MGHWTLDDIPWEQFDRSKVDPDILRLVKAASLVEQNGGDYARYLCGVFHDDAAFQAVARRWGEEEIQHGQALGRWAMLADPGFDHDAASRRFTEGFRVELDPTRSVRGSRSGELVARFQGADRDHAALELRAAERRLAVAAAKLAALAAGASH